jgi:hypothetical protein
LQSVDFPCNLLAKRKGINGLQNWQQSIAWIFQRIKNLPGLRKINRVKPVKFQGTGFGRRAVYG